MGDHIGDEILLNDDLIHLGVGGVAGRQMGGGPAVHQRVIDPFDEAQAFEQLAFVIDGAEMQHIQARLVALVGVARRQQAAELRLGGRGEAKNSHGSHKQFFHDLPLRRGFWGWAPDQATLYQAQGKGNFQPAGGLPSRLREAPMPLISVIVVLLVVGVLLWLVNTYIPMDGKIKSILNAVVVIAVVLWLLQVFGLLNVLDGIRVGK